MSAAATLRDATAAPGAPATAGAAGRAVVGAQAGLGFIISGYGPYLAGLSADLDRPAASLVWISSAFGIGLVVAAAGGPVVLRPGAGRVLRASAMAAAAGAAAMAATSWLPAVAVGAVLVGLGCAAIVLLTPVLLSGARAARRLTRAMGAAAAAALCAPVAFGALELVDAPGRLALLVPLPILVAIALRPTVPAPAAAATSDRPRLPITAATRGWIRIFVVVGCEYVFVVWGVTRLLDTGVSMAAASILGAAYAVGMTIGRLGGQWIADRRWAFAAATGAVAVGTIVAAGGSGAGVVAAGIMTASMGVALLFPLALADLLKVSGLTTARAAAIGTCAQGTAVLAAPAALGLLGTVIDLRLAMLLPLLLLAVLLAVPRPQRMT
jgi:hypothetical protein